MCTESRALGHSLSSCFSLFSELVNSISGASHLFELWLGSDTYVNNSDGTASLAYPKEGSLGAVKSVNSINYTAFEALYCTGVKNDLSSEVFVTPLAQRMTVALPLPPMT